MDTKDLQRLVAANHERHFGRTPLAERLRDLSHQVAELAHHRDADHLRTEAEEERRRRTQRDETRAASDREEVRRLRAALEARAKSTTAHTAYA